MLTEWPMETATFVTAKKMFALSTIFPYHLSWKMWIFLFLSKMTYSLINSNVYNLLIFSTPLWSSLQIKIHPMPYFSICDQSSFLPASANQLSFLFWVAVGMNSLNLSIQIGIFQQPINFCNYCNFVQLKNNSLNPALKNQIFACQHLSNICLLPHLLAQVNLNFNISEIELWIIKFSPASING